MLNRERRAPDRGVPTGEAHEHVLESLAEPLLEGGAVALAVIGEHDELIAARSAPRQAQQSADGGVDRRRCGERLGARGPGVVGNLVVAGEIHVDRGSAVGHLLGDEFARHEPEGARGETPFDCGDEAPVHPWSPPCLPLRDGVPGFGEDLSEDDRDKANIGRRSQEVAAGPFERTRPAGTVRHRRHRQVRPDGVTGDQVADAHPIVGEEPPAIRDSADDLGGVGRMVADEQPAGALLVPAEPGDVVIATVQDPGLARGRAGRPEG